MSKETIAFAVIGIVLIVLGIITWKKQTTAFLHSYHYKNVKEEVLPVYTKQMGIGQIIIGIAFCLAALFRLLSQMTVSWVVLVAGLAAGLAFILKAQSNHNGSLF